MSRQHGAEPEKKQPTRREFLQRTAQVTGAVAATSAVGPSLAGAASAASRVTVHSSDKVVLRFQNWFNQSDMVAWNIGINRVKKLYPNIDVSMEFVDYNDTAVKTIASSLAGEVPDLIMASTDHTPALISNGILLTLDPYIKRDGAVNVSDFARGVASGFNVLGHWYGFPYDVTTFGIYYNKGMFDKAGVKYPPASGRPWTYDEFVAAAKALTKPNGKQWGIFIANPPYDQYTMSNFVFSAGGRNFNDSLDRCIINSPESAQGLQFAVDLIHKYKVTPTPQDLAGSTVDYFGSGLAAMTLGAPWSLINMLPTTKFPFDAGLLPIGKYDRLVTGGSGFTISATSKYKEEAWNFLKVFTSSSVLAEMIGGTGRGCPARYSAAPAFAKFAQSRRITHGDIFVQQLHHAINDREALAMFEYLQSWNRELEPIFRSGQGDILAALNRVAATTNTALAKKIKAAKFKF